MKLLTSSEPLKRLVLMLTAVTMSGGIMTSVGGFWWHYAMAPTEQRFVEQQKVNVAILAGLKTLSDRVDGMDALDRSARADSLMLNRISRLASHIAVLEASVGGLDQKTEEIRRATSRHSR